VGFLLSGEQAAPCIQCVTLSPPYERRKSFAKFIRV